MSIKKISERALCVRAVRISSILVWKYVVLKRRRFKKRRRRFKKRRRRFKKRWRRFKRGGVALKNDGVALKNDGVALKQATVPPQSPGGTLCALRGCSF
jgi:hypothetical protein